MCCEEKKGERERGENGGGREWKKERGEGGGGKENGQRKKRKFQTCIKIPTMYVHVQSTRSQNYFYSIKLWGGGERERRNEREG